MQYDDDRSKTTQDFEAAISLLNEFPASDYVIKTDPPEGRRRL
jgi:hypothetical protein